jgi:tRNA isopentenyl-2-thiomethyl-A-37 hydroxylase MiaE
MKTSKQWWEETKNNPEKFNKWLSQQWLAEKEAFDKIKQLSFNDPKNASILTKIATDELKHSYLLESLCTKRGVEIAQSSSDRYYGSIKLQELSQDELYAIGHYAEGMRLDRIRAIVEDTDTPEDVSFAFNIILKDEIMHEKAFGAIASKSALNSMKNKHELGVQALGLTL